MSDDLFQIERIKDFSQQIAEEFTKNLTKLEEEIVQLNGLLISNDTVLYTKEVNIDKH